MAEKENWTEKVSLASAMSPLRPFSMSQKSADGRHEKKQSQQVEERNWNFTTKIDVEKAKKLKNSNYHEHLDMAYSRRVNVLKYKVSSQIGLIHEKLQKYVLPFLDTQMSFTHNLELSSIKKQNEQKEELMAQILRHHKASLDQIRRQTEEAQGKLEKRKEEAKKLCIQIEQYK